MNIIVCGKAVPHVIGSIALQTDRKDICKNDFSYKINDTDDNALEEAMLLRERFGGKVTVLTLSSQDEQENSRQVLYECLAKGADEAILLTDELFTDIDAYTVAQLLSTVIRTLPYDLILTGSQALDDNLGNVGPMMAAFLDVPYATLVVKLEITEGKLVTRTELDEGLQQVVELIPPALLAVQSGINEPRYASLSKIRLAQNKPIRKLSAKDINASAESVDTWRKVRTNSCSTAVNKQTEFIHGTSDEVASKLAKIIESESIHTAR
jgi:electron transfer flavoprotein beta subunit